MEGLRRRLKYIEARTVTVQGDETGLEKNVGIARALSISAPGAFNFLARPSQALARVAQPPYAILIAPLPLKHRFERHSFWIIFAVSSLIRIAKVLAAPRPPGTHLSEMENIARSLALHGTFADPYLLPTGPTAHTAPRYPIVLGLIFLLFGTGIAGEMVSRIASAIVSSIQYALL